MLSYDFLDVAFSPYGNYWREMRKLFILELVSMRRVQSFAYARAAEVDRLVASLAAAAAGRSPPAGAPVVVDLSEKLYALSDGIVGTVAFGKMYGSAQFGRSSFQRVMDDTVRVLGSFTFEDFFPASRLARCADALTGRRRRAEAARLPPDRPLLRLGDRQAPRARAAAGRGAGGHGGRAGEDVEGGAGRRGSRLDACPHQGYPHGIVWSN